MLTTDGECKIGAPRGPISSSIARVSANSSRQRNLVPAKMRRTHIDRKHPLAGAPARDYSRRGFEGELGLAGLGADQGGDAAHAVAAGARFRSVVVVDADRRIGAAAAARRIKRHQLIVGLLARGRARLGRLDRARRSPQVDDHDLIAETVHLDEVAIGQRAHDKARM